MEAASVSHSIFFLIPTLCVTAKVKCRKGHSSYGQLLRCWGQRGRAALRQAMKQEKQGWFLNWQHFTSLDVLGCSVGTCCPSLSSLSMCRSVVFPALSSPRNTSFPVFLYNPDNKKKTNRCWSHCILVLWLLFVFLNLSLKEDNDEQQNTRFSFFFFVIFRNSITVTVNLCYYTFIYIYWYVLEISIIPNTNPIRARNW